jgi:3-phosphoglycerate kinase
MNKKTIRDINLAGKRVLVRVDFNVPIENGVITSDKRIRESVPTIQYILEQKPKAVILMSHLGRPKDAPEPKYSLAPVAPALAALIGRSVHFAEDCIGPVAEKAVANLPDGGVLLLENTRFYKGESKNDQDMARQLAALGDIYVNDAFGSAHRAHASTVGVTEYLPAVAGFLMEKELDYLATAIENPKRPFVAILGGAKVSDKIAVIEALLDKVDKLLIGGGMANTFLKAKNLNLGNSLVEADSVDTARALLEKGSAKLILPIDAVIGEKFENDTAQQTISVADGVPDGWAIYDIGPRTVDLFKQHLQGAQTVVWNGPMGVFEMPAFAKGTNAVAQLLAEATEQGAITVIGGGDSASAVENAGFADRVTHISTGGGASLEMLEGKILPGVAALADR